jgi:hypothetical protein
MAFWAKIAQNAKVGSLVIGRYTKIKDWVRKQFNAII